MRTPLTSECLAIARFQKPSANMACSLEGLTTPKGKHVSFDDIKAILASVDTGQPFQVHIDNKATENDQKRVHLQIYSGSDITIDTNNSGIKRVEHIDKPYDSLELVKQLQSLRLDDELVLMDVLTSSQPVALSQLTEAHRNNSMIPLVTAKDGRVFLISAGLLASSEWAGKYPMDFSNDSVRKLSDPVLGANRITPYQEAALMEILSAVSHTKDSREFRKSVKAVRPEIWNSYKEVIAEPVDLSFMHSMLFDSRYATMADFRRHVDLLQQNAETFNGDRNKFITEAAVKVRMDIYRRMDAIPAEKPSDEGIVTRIRRIVYADDDSSGLVADDDIEDDDTDNFIVSDDTTDYDGVSGDEDEEISREETSHEEASHEAASGLNPATGEAGHSALALPLGRLCVARRAGDVEAILTPYIVIMDIQSPCKALWLFKDNYTRVGLPEDKKTLLDFGGKYNFTIGMLADDISDWKVRGGTGCRAGRRTQGVQSPTLSWANTERSIRQSSETDSPLFDLVNVQQAGAAIRKGWVTTTKILSDYRDEDSGSSESDYRRMREEYDDPDDETYVEREPPRKRRTR